MIQIAPMQIATKRRMVAIKRRLDLSELVNFIPPSPYGADVLGTVGHHVHFFTQATDVDGNGNVVLAVILLAPNVLKQIFSADNTSTMLTENL